MKIDLTIKNYRCFSDAMPARITLQKGFIALLGVDNSGKSSLLKFFYELRDLFQRFSDGNSRDVIEALKGNRPVFNYPGSVSDLEEVFCNRNVRDMQIRVRVIPGVGLAAPEEPLPSEELVITIPRGTNTWQASAMVAGNTLQLTDPVIRAHGDKRVLVSGGSELLQLAPYFEAFRKLSNTLYVGAFRNAINVGSMPAYFDIAVGQAFISQWRGLKTGGQRRQNEATYALTEDIRHIFGFNALEINPTPDDQTLQLFINGKSYRLTELGSGLAQFVLVLANAAVKRPAYILIDEPELNLHPSLQIDFLTTLASYATEGILFATHSYGLARATGELVYSLRQNEDGISEVLPFEATPRLSEFLGELSHAGYKELGFDEILLVEGATEVKTIHQFLRKLGKDHQVVLLPLGGSQLIRESSEAELVEITRISNNVFALIDSERSAPGAPLEPARESFKQVCQRIGIVCHVLERRATENYLTDAAVKRVKGSNYQALGPYEQLRKLGLGWGKAENWRIAREMTVQEWEDTDLGEFLASL